MAALYDHLDDLDWISNREQSWYQEYMGQVTAPTGLHQDYYFYSFSDLTSQYNLNVEVAAKCDDGKASCVLVPRDYLSTLEDRTVTYGYDHDHHTFLVGKCSIEPRKHMGKHCILFCQAKQACKFAFKLKSWSSV